MVTHTIEELHELFKSGELDVKEYYKELFEEAKKQQERLNAFVTITEDEAYKAIEAPMTDDLLSHIPYVLKDNYNTKGIKTTASSKMLADYVPVFNAHVVDLLNKHGVGLVGKASSSVRFDFSQMGTSFIGVTSILLYFYKEIYSL